VTFSLFLSWASIDWFLVGSTFKILSFFLNLNIDYLENLIIKELIGHKFTSILFGKFSILPQVSEFAELTLLISFGKFSSFFSITVT